MSAPTLSAQELYDQVGKRLELNWVAGGAGGDRRIDVPENRSRRPSLVGYLNLIHPNKVQVLGSEELAYLKSLPQRTRRATLKKIADTRPAVLIISRGLAVPDDLLDLATEHQIPLWMSPRAGHEIHTYLQYHLARALARRTTQHGVFMEVYSIGVLITGESGSGKSELALELITRGHRLIADDAPEFTLIAPDVIDGTCPDVLQDCLEVRGLGVLNVREMFGDTAIKRNKYLRLIIHLAPEKHDGFNEAEGLRRIYGDTNKRALIDVEIPQINIPVAPGRNLAVLVEAAVRNHILKTKGIDAAQIFLDRQAHQMRKEQLW
jgi:HPr kinase/phosphorylase